MIYAQHLILFYAKIIRKNPLNIKKESILFGSKGYGH